jgi:hypothetical protein
MANRIGKMYASARRMSPNDAEVYVSAYPEQLTSSTQVVGRLVGPRCRYASTVEVAYPLREVSRAYEKEDVPHIILRALIPEPSYWAPETPFLYELKLELWQQGQRCDQMRQKWALHTKVLGSRGLRLNGQLIALKGIAQDHGSEEDLVRWREAGCNCLLINVSPATSSLWNLADEIGLLMLGRVSTQASAREIQDLRDHVSCLGWVIHEVVLQDSLVAAISPGWWTHDNQLAGFEVNSKASEALAQGWHFLACDESLLPSIEKNPLPKILYTRAPLLPGATPASQLPSNTLGWIHLG